MARQRLTRGARAGDGGVRVGDGAGWLRGTPSVTQDQDTASTCLASAEKHGEHRLQLERRLAGLNARKPSLSAS